MKINFTAFNKISFGHVIPVKKIVLEKGQTGQLSFDFYEASSRDEIDTSVDEKLAKKTIQALNRILSKNDGVEPYTYDNALNKMIRTRFSSVDYDYKIPSKPIPSKDNKRLKPLYDKDNDKRYILTGSEAAQYAQAGKSIGGAKALVRDYNVSKNFVSKSRTDYHSCKDSLLYDSSLRLKGPNNQDLGLVIYADKVEVPYKGKKGTRTEIEIRGIDFERVRD